MLRSEGWAGWGVGLLFGAATGFMILLGGAPLLAVSLAFIARGVRRCIGECFT
jgi:hypothetical protein